MRFPTSVFLAQSVIVSTCWLSQPACGQTYEEAELCEEEHHDHIETDRDSFTPSPRIVHPGRFVVEGSHTFLDQPGSVEGHLYPDLLVRYGATDWLELRLGWTYEVAKLHHLAHGHHGEPPEEGIAIYGAKAYMTRAQGWVPDSSLIVSGFTPTSGESNDTDLTLDYVYGWESEDGWELDGALRWWLLAEGHDHFQEWAPSVVLKKQVGENLNLHLEYFAELSIGKEVNYRQHYAGPGVHYLITPNLEIGTRVFWGMSNDSADFIANSGLGVRF